MSILTRQRVRDEGYTDPPYTDARVDSAILELDNYIERLTGNIFEPRTLTLNLDGTGKNFLSLPFPACYITSVKIDGSTVADSDYVVYNRHMTGMLNPDDRRNPKIQFKRSSLSSSSIMGYSRNRSRTFPRGEQNIEVTGVFAYRDYNPSEPDLDAPVGSMALDLQRVALIIIERFLELEGEPYAFEARRNWDIQIQSTRGNKIERGGAITSGKLVGELTLDPVIDKMLSRFMAPSRVRFV